MTVSDTEGKIAVKAANAAQYRTILRLLRARNPRLTINRIAAAAGVSATTVRRWTSGRKTIPWEKLTILGKLQQEDDARHRILSK